MITIQNENNDYQDNNGNNDKNIQIVTIKNNEMRKKNE